MADHEALLATGRELIVVVFLVAFVVWAAWEMTRRS